MPVVGVRIPLVVILLVTVVCCRRGVPVTDVVLPPVSSCGENPGECGFVGTRVDRV